MVRVYKNLMGDSSKINASEIAYKDGDNLKTVTDFIAANNEFVKVRTHSFTMTINSKTTTNSAFNSFPTIGGYKLIAVIPMGAYSNSSKTDHFIDVVISLTMVSASVYRIMAYSNRSNSVDAYMEVLGIFIKE